MDNIGPISLWEYTSEEQAAQSAALPEEVLDVAIVGGGYTGLSTALHTAEKGLSAHVFEANHIGFGGSGRNVGLVNASAWLPPEKIQNILGPVYGDRFIRQFSDGPQYVFDLIERYQIRCEPTKTGTLHVAHSAKGLKDLQARFGQWQRLGEPVDLLSAEETADMVGSERFFGALLDHRAGTINPMSYCRGLARAASAAGAKISTGVRVQELKQIGDLWQVTTSSGLVRAKAVVLGTNAYTDDLWPGLKDIFHTIHYMQVSSASLGSRADKILPARQGLWDTGKIMFSLRKDMDNRLIIGTKGRAFGTAQQGLTQRWAQKMLKAMFPDLGAVSIAEVWHGKIAMTPDHLPALYQLASGLWTPIGYNGRGIATGTLFGQAMSEILTGKDPVTLPLPITTPRPAPLRRLTQQIYDMAFSAKQLWKAL